MGHIILNFGARYMSWLPILVDQVKPEFDAFEDAFKAFWKCHLELRVGVDFLYDFLYESSHLGH